MSGSGISIIIEDNYCDLLFFSFNHVHLQRGEVNTKDTETTSGSMQQERCQALQQHVCTDEERDNCRSEGDVFRSLLLGCSV